MIDPRVQNGMRSLLEARAALLAEGARPLGWKVGFNVPLVQEKLGIDRPLAGFLTSAGLLESGATWSLDQGPVLVESEVAVEIGEDGRSIAALLPALELAAPIDLSLDLDVILAGNIFHRAVAFGERLETKEPGPGRILVNGEEEHPLSVIETAAHLDEMVEAVRSRLKEAGEELRPGERIITGVLAPPHPAQPGEQVRLELEALGAVELAFA